MIQTKNQLPDTSRVWIYQSHRPFTDEEIAKIEEKAAAFNVSWEAHGKKLNSAIEIYHGQFVVFFVDESPQAATGCSIDKSVAFVKSIEQEFGVDMFDRLNIAYSDAGAIKTEKMASFQSLISEGKVTQDTLVFNNMIENKGDFINRWQVKASESWHANLF